MDFKRHFETGWQNTLQFIGPIILLTFIQAIVIVISFGVLAPVTMAGYTKSLLLASREGRTPDIKDLFSEMGLFFPLLGFFVVIFFAICIGFMFLIIPGFIVSALVLFACLYLIPIMVDQRLGLIDALKLSWEMAIREPIADQAIITIIYFALLSIGGSLGGVGILVTQPLATFIVLSVYQERLGNSLGIKNAQSTPPPPPPVH
jgi:uncharacterized membrane protein